MTLSTAFINVNQFHTRMPLNDSENWHYIINFRK